MSPTIAVPDTYIKPTVRFGLSDNEREVLKLAQDAMQIAEVIDGEQEHILDGEPAREKFTEAQAVLLLSMRIFIGALMVGNTVEDAHLTVAAMLTANKEDAETVALDWANPDMSELTGEEIDMSSWPDPSKQVRNIAMRANQAFRHCVLAVPSVIRWTKMGIDLGLDAETVKDAAGSLLNFEEILGDYECACAGCKGEIEL